MSVNSNKRYFINAAFMAVHIIYFTYINMIGVPDDFIILLKYGGLYLPSIKDGEYWRILVSIFMHVGMAHIFCDMVSQFILGSRLERALGRIKFFVFYLVCGICANVICLQVEINKSLLLGSDKLTMSVGASGAICGLTGGLLYVTQANKGKFAGLTNFQVLLSFIFWLIYGLINPNINNNAHITGFITGYLLAIILYRRPKTMEEIEANQNMVIAIAEDRGEEEEENWEDLN